MTTDAASGITSTSATSGGNVTTEGETTVTARGVCWSTSPTPTTADSYTSDGTGTGTFVSSLTGLTPGTLYYVRAYATNSVGTTYGNQESFTTLGYTTCPGIPTVTYSGQTYNTILIGTQCWLRENLNVGTRIDGNLDQTDNSIIEKYCYDNLETNCDTYGGLYQWNELMQYVTTEGVKGICPTGWHIPTDNEFTTLTTFLGGTLVAGGKMKEAGTNHWQSPNIGATNSSGFSALPSGYRYNSSEFRSQFTGGYFWTSTEISTLAWNRMLVNNMERIYSNQILKSNGFPCRCLLNELPTVTTDASTSIGPTTATSGGIVVMEGMSAVTARGVCWSTSANPTTANSFTTDGTGTGTFTSNLTGLTPGTLYYVRAYATNSVGTAYGNQESFTTLALPTVTTDAVSAITSTTATSGGDVTSDGGAAVTARGVCWSTNPTPTTADSHTTDGTGTGTFTSSLTGLTAGTLYYVRAYATNSVGTAYGNQESFTTLGYPTCPGIATVSYSGQTYNTVLIGTQCWLRENLNIGTRIDGNLDQTDNSIIEKYCYDNLETNCDTYGGLYQWNELMQYVTTEGVKGICPTGWHIPTDAEFTTLTTFLGGTSVAGGKMKEAGLLHWSAPNTGATNSSGFTALPGGYRYFSSNFLNLEDNSYFWSSTESTSSNAWNRLLSYNSESSFRSGSSELYGLSCRCLLSETPTVTTDAATSIGQTTATSGGNVLMEGMSSVTARGVCWSTSQNPTTADSHTTDGTGTGTFTSNLTTLTPNTLYYVRAYATNSVGTAYGNQESFTTLGYPTCPGIATVSYSGKTYNTVLIGTQCWLRENLNVGIKIFGNLDQTDNSSIEKYCYDNLETNCDTYGGLYQWDEMMQYVTTEGVQGICPTGWHIPTDAEFTTLTTFLGGVTIAGGKMKEAGTLHWAAPNAGATNSSGFTALPGGYRYFSSNFLNLADNAIFWSSTEYSPTNAYYRILYHGTEYFGRNNLNKTDGFSCRCLLNELPTVTTDAASSIGPTTATSGGNVLMKGISAVTARGVCWSTSQNPTTADSHTTDGTGTGTFTSSLTGLTAGTLYYVRAYATNSVGTAYGNQVSFTTLNYPICPGIPTVTYSGQTYNTILIGTQCWLRENLNVGVILDETEAQTDNSIIEKHCDNNMESNCDTYGGLYRWDELMQYVTTEGAKGICPTGWHIPTDVEYTTLTTFLSGPSVAGGKLKESGTVHWLTPNTGATNESGFTALPGGYRHSNGFFSGLGLHAYFWSSTQDDATFAWSRILIYNSEEVNRMTNNKMAEYSCRCLLNELPTVTTDAASSIGPTSATSGGNVVMEGMSAVTTRGVCWSTSPTPTTADSYTTDGTGTGTFISSLTGLTPGTLYYVRAYATNSVGTAYGNQVSFTTLNYPICPGIPTVTYSGQTYNTILIGTQCWLRENLNVGTRIDGTLDQTDNSIIEKYCYDDLETNCNTYGGLYQWDELMQYVTTAGAQGICPTGWHIPTDAEWTTLETYLGGASVAGGKVKETGTSHWAPPNTGATNESDFTALPGGTKNTSGFFYNLAYYALFWSSTEHSSASAWFRRLEYYNGIVVRDNYNKTEAFSCRCVKD